MTIAANVSTARTGYTQLRTDNMYDTLVGVTQTIEFDTEFFTVFGQCFYLEARKLFLYRQMLLPGWYVMVGSCNRFVWSQYFTTRLAQTIKSLRAGNFMDEVRVDV